jgi:hypothetical protein
MENIKLPDGDGGVAYNVTVEADTVEIEFETPCGDFNTTTWAWLTFA